MSVARSFFLSTDEQGFIAAALEAMTIPEGDGGGMKAKRQRLLEKLSAPLPAYEMVDTTDKFGLESRN